MGSVLSAQIRDRRRARIIAAAQDVFFAHGYGATTMGLVAERLGGSKATLYAYFRTKDELCEAVALLQGERLLAGLDAAGAEQGFEAQLTHVGMAFLAVCLSDEGVRGLQLAMEGSRSNPALAQRFEAKGLRPINEKLADLVAAADARGEIAAPDPADAAQVFMGLVGRDLHLRRLLGLIPEPDQGQMWREATRACQSFLALYGPNGRQQERRAASRGDRSSEGEGDDPHLRPRSAPAGAPQ